MTSRHTSQFKRSMVRRWLYSYLAASLVPAILAVLFGIFCTHKVLRSAQDSSFLILQSASLDLDVALNGMDSIGQGLLIDDRFLPYKDAEPTSMEYYQASTSLRNLVPPGSIAGAMVFNPQLGRYIGEEQWGSFSEFYQRNEFDLDMERSEFNSIFGVDVQRLRIFNADMTYRNEEVAHRLLIIKPLNYAKAGKLHGWYLACVVNIGEIFSPIYSGERDLVMLQGDQVIYSFSGEVALSSSHPELLTKKQVGGNSVVTRQSRSGPYSYALLTDRKVMFQLMAGYLVMVAVILGFLIALGVYMLCSRLRKDWSSFESALKASGTEVDQNFKVENEYLPFVSSMKGLQKQKEGMSDLIKAQTETLKQRTLNELVEHGEPVSLATLKECGIVFHGNLFIVAVFVLPTTLSSKEFEVTLTRELSENGLAAFPVESNHGSAFILNSKRAIGDEELRKVERVSEQSGCLYAASSSMVNDFAKLGEAYLEAINVLEYEKGRNTHEFLSYNDVRGMTSQVSFIYSTEEELELVKLIHDGAAMESVALIERVFNKNRADGASPKCLRYLLFSMASTVYRTASKLDARYTDSLPELTLPPIIQGDNLERSLKEVEELVQKLCLSVAKVNSQYADSSSRNYALYQKSIELVQAHYSEQSFNVSQLADMLGVSIVYLSRTFKKFHTTNISDYITRYRLFMSKKLLSEGMKVSEVASACGFGSLRTYLRVFKQVEQVTPGQYRGGNTTVEKE